MKPLRFELSAASNENDIAVLNTDTDPVRVGNAGIVLGRDAVHDSHDLEVTEGDGGRERDPRRSKDEVFRFLAV